MCFRRDSRSHRTRTRPLPPQLQLGGFGQLQALTVSHIAYCVQPIGASGSVVIIGSVSIWQFPAASRAGIVCVMSLNTKLPAG